MEQIEFELDNSNNIKIDGKRILLSAENFPIKVRTACHNGKEQKRIINLRIKHGILKIMMS
jgi:hypothetical protein